MSFLQAGRIYVRASLFCMKYYSGKLAYITVLGDGLEESHENPHWWIFINSWPLIPFQKKGKQRMHRAIGREKRTKRRVVGQWGAAPDQLTVPRTAWDDLALNERSLRTHRAPRCRKILPKFQNMVHRHWLQTPVAYHVSNNSMDSLNVLQSEISALVPWSRAKSIKHAFLLRWPSKLGGVDGGRRLETLRAGNVARLHEDKKKSGRNKRKRTGRESKTAEADAGTEASLWVRPVE